jgi:colanic acid/amylovoran biosynthesis protein
MLTDVHGPHVAISHYLTLVLARLLAKPYVICAQSVGPFGWSRRFAVWLLRGAQWITVREDISLRALADMKVGDHVQRTADLAFLMDPEPAAATTGVLDRASVDEDAALLIGVSVSGLVAGANARARMDRDTDFFEESVAQALDAVATKHDAEIMLVPQVTGPAESKDDRRISRRVAARMQHAARVVEDDLDPPMLKAVIARSDIFVGCRMHANIAAISSCVPTTAMSYSHKSDGIMDFVGLGDRVLAAADVDAASLEQIVERLLDDRAAVHAYLEQIMPSVRAASERNFELIDESLGFNG